MRTVNKTRKTKETDIRLTLSLDGQGHADISTGLGFFDHMLTALCVHAGFDMTLKVKGDLEVDSHHTAEDTGLVLGAALAEALGDKKGIRRFADCRIPMDEALSSCALDISGRPFLVCTCSFSRQFIGQFDTAMIGEFMRAFATAGGLTLHVENLYGSDDHHKAESMFKALAHALKKAVKIKGDKVLSSKGTL